MLRYPISYETLFDLTASVRNGTRFACVGRTLLSFDPRHMRLLYRDGYGEPVQELRLWHGAEIIGEHDKVTIRSGDCELEVNVSNLG